MEVKIKSIDGKNIVFTVDNKEISGRIVLETSSGRNCNEYIVYAQNRLVLIVKTLMKHYITDEYGDVIDMEFDTEEEIRVLVEYCSIPELD